MDKMVRITNAWTGEIVAACTTYEQAKEFIVAEAARDNCGMFRFWEIDGVEHYDVGPRVYAIQDISSNAENTIDEA